MSNKLTLTLRSSLITCLFLLVIVKHVNAQEKDIYELDNATIAKTQGQVNKGKYKKGSSLDRVEFYNLIENIYTTYYVNNGKIKKAYGDGKPKKLALRGTGAFNYLKTANHNFKNIEIITITLDTISEIQNTMDLSSLKGFDNLKYIFIRCYFKPNEAQIKSFIKTKEHNRVFYKMENPS
ncbi:hypothetical protein GCM10022291_03560 [Postechiella marina]|uniref:Uncharacterized protein n=1 Tax=Postechiella marina TaxID=943941 RepID=A0ABP8C040_9FLAO